MQMVLNIPCGNTLRIKGKNLVINAGNRCLSLANNGRVKAAIPVTGNS